MQQSTVTNKGQVTIPIDLRRLLQIKEGDRVNFTRSGSQISIDILHKKSLSDLHGFLPKPKKSLTIEEMNDIISQKR